MKKASWFPLFLGLRNFYSFRKGRKRTMAGAAVAVALSVIPLVVVIEVSDGMIEGITRRFIELETGHIQVSAIADYGLEEYDEMSRRIKTLPNVLAASPVYRGTGLIYSSGSRTGIQVKGLEPGVYSEDQGFSRYLEILQGSFDLESPSSIMLSSEIAGKLNARVGDPVKLLTARTMNNGRVVLRPEQFEVTGIFSTGYYEVDSLSGYINIETAQKLFSEEGYLCIQCKIDDPYGNITAAADQISSLLGPGISVSAWYSMQRSMYESLYTTRVVLVFIMAIIMIVASFNITSSMIIMVIERRTDIAILKSCGAGNRQIRQSFIFTGLITGITGAAAGIAAGLLISVNINSIIGIFRQIAGILSSGDNNSSFSIASASAYYLDKIPIKIDTVKILSVGIGALALSTLAAVLPAKKAEKMTPLDIMRKH